MHACVPAGLDAGSGTCMHLGQLLTRACVQRRTRVTQTLPPNQTSLQHVIPGRSPRKMQNAIPRAIVQQDWRDYQLQKLCQYLKNPQKMHLVWNFHLIPAQTTQQED
jgi:hypothetical protein